MNRRISVATPPLASKEAMDPYFLHVTGFGTDQYRDTWLGGPFA